MTRIVLAISHHENEDHVVYQTIDAFPVTIGRGYDNDVILSDPYVAAHQARISVRDDGQWYVENIGGSNPVRVNERVFSWPMRCVSGDTLQVGATRIMLFRPDHHVPPAVILDEGNKGVMAFVQPSRAWVLYGVMLLLISLWSYVAVWDEKPALVIVSVLAGVSILVFVWSGLWSVVGRLAHKTAAFKGHVSMMSAYIMLLFFVWWFGNSIAFLLNENAFAQILSYIMDAAALMFLLYGALTLATRMTQHKRILASAFCAFGLAIGIFSVGLVASRNFTSELPMSLLLKPYLAPIVSTVPMEQFIAESADLFQSGS